MRNNHFLKTIKEHLYIAGENLADLNDVDMIRSIDFEKNLVVINIKDEAFRALFDNYLIERNPYSVSFVYIYRTFPELGFVIKAATDQREDVQAVYEEVRKEDELAE
jgi:hypothetical protein